ncbi:MAG TPA: hypothetical protein VGC75_00970 [Candidatus Nitrosocosmicus sp.]
MRDKTLSMCFSYYFNYSVGNNCAYVIIFSGLIDNTSLRPIAPRRGSLRSPVCYTLDLQLARGSAPWTLALSQSLLLNNLCKNIFKYSKINFKKPTNQ